MDQTAAEGGLAELRNTGRVETVAAPVPLYETTGFKHMPSIMPGQEPIDAPAENEMPGFPMFTVISNRCFIN
jgi:hypothetical protein